MLQHEELEKALKKRFVDHLLGEVALTRLVIPAFTMPKTEIAVFKTDHHKDFKNDHATPMWKVARATSAAPTDLRGLEHEESGRIFIDGGVWANNPVMVALVDAVTSYDVSFDQVKILSIGTGNAPFSLQRPKVIRWRDRVRRGHQGGNVPDDRQCHRTSQVSAWARPLPANRAGPKRTWRLNLMTMTERSRPYQRARQNILKQGSSRLRGTLRALP